MMQAELELLEDLQLLLDAGYLELDTAVEAEGPRLLPTRKALEAAGQTLLELDDSPQD